MNSRTLLSAILLSLTALHSFAGSLPKQLVMATDVGKVVITAEPCGIVWYEKLPYKYHAYATEVINGKEVVHPGCWHREELAVNIWFPEINAIATYKADYFKPESK